LGEGDYKNRLKVKKGSRTWAGDSRDCQSRASKEKEAGGGQIKKYDGKPVSRHRDPQEKKEGKGSGGGRSGKKEF